MDHPPSAQGVAVGSVTFATEPRRGDRASEFLNYTGL